MVPTNLRSKQPSQSPTVVFKNDSTFIYVLTDSVPSQKFSRRAVITGMSDGIQIEIKNGLNVNEKVRGAEKK